MTIKCSRKAFTYSLLLSFVIISSTYFTYKKILTTYDKHEHELLITELSKASYFQNKATFNDKIDTLRYFIVDNTSYNMNEEFYKTWRSDKAMAQNILDYLSKKRPDEPPFECASRRGLMAAILGLSNIRTRDIDVYDSDNNLSSHSFLEVYNPETKKWEIQDPAFDVFWKNSITGERASISEILSNPENFIPCGRDKCGWDIQSNEKVQAANLKQWLKIASIIDRKKKKRFTLYSKNVDTASKYNFNGKKGNFCDVIAKNCKDGFWSISEFKDYDKNKE